MLSRGFVCDGNLVKLDGGQARQSGYGDESISPVVEMEDTGSSNHLLSDKLARTRAQVGLWGQVLLQGKGQSSRML